MPEEWVTEWRAALGDFLSEVTGPVLDVGAGTGIWASFIATWFDVNVVGLEPSHGMRERVAVARNHNRVRYVGGEAERLPLRDESCGALWLSTVVHHVPNLGNAAREARRGLRLGQPLLIRQGFSGRHDEVLWTTVFPSALAIAEERHPRLESVVETFESAGFEHQETRRVREVAAADLHHYVRKAESRADSKRQRHRSWTRAFFSLTLGAGSLSGHCCAPRSVVPDDTTEVIDRRVDPLAGTSPGSEQPRDRFQGLMHLVSHRPKLAR